VPKSTYLDNKDIDHNLGTTTFTKPTAVYVGLFTTNPTAAGTGTEVTGGSYARQAGAFSAAAAGATANTSTLTWLNMPSCTITHFAIYDAVSGGNMLYFNALGASQVVNVGNTVTAGVGALTVSET